MTMKNPGSTRTFNWFKNILEKKIMKSKILAITCLFSAFLQDKLLKFQGLSKTWNRLSWHQDRTLKIQDIDRTLSGNVCSVMMWFFANAVVYAEGLQNMIVLLLNPWVPVVARDKLQTLTRSRF